MQHAEFQWLLDEIAGRDQSARLRTIDKYDYQRKHYGKVAAENWLVDQPQLAYLQSLKPSIADAAARDRLDFMLKNGDKATIDLITSCFKKGGVRNFV